MTEHLLPVSNFLQASKSAVTIIDRLNQQILGGRFEYELFIVPPEKGSFLKKIGIIAAAGTVIATPIIQDYALGAFEGITGNRPSHYGRNHTEALRDLAVGFFQTEVDGLEKLLEPSINLDKAFKAKSEFYEMCIGNDRIHGLGFDDTTDFPITRPRFIYHTSKDRLRAVASDFIICDAVIVSPVNTNKDLKWELQDTITHNKISAYLRDDDFKSGLLNGKYPQKKTKSDDVLKVLIEYKKQERNGEVENKDICINTVYEFNGAVIKALPKDLPSGTRFQRYEEAPMDRLWRYGT
jgi:hypothetical protein